MDWTVADYAHANHQPVIDVEDDSETTPIFLDAEVGKPFTLDASGSRDPDGQVLHYSWFHYEEAGSTGANLAALTIKDADKDEVTITATAVCRPKWLAGRCSGDGVAHVILAVTDEGSPRLTSYRRIIVTVHAAK